MKKIMIFDTSICTQNIGDKIIMDSAGLQIEKLFGDSFYISVPTHEKIGFPSYQAAKNSDHKIVCGTNLLSSNMNSYNQRKINILDTFFLKNITLLGVGWWQYQGKPNLYTQYILKSVLGSDLQHSVRDGFTKKQLESIGIKNVLNTSCPTMWDLTPDFCSSIPTKKGENVVFTLTDYSPNIQQDRVLIDILLKNYSTVSFRVQGEGDLKYLKKLGNYEKIKIVSPTLKAFDALLKGDDSLDYVGTRLHAGIRALNHKRRTIIIGIDNRATEKRRDFNLVVVDRNDITTALEEKITGSINTNITIPTLEIAKRKGQF